ncbi:MAG: DNA topoisomerase [Eubacteriales bacterium]|nr:DNA topoisomerase [Eubacteriales bacterium]
MSKSLYIAEKPSVAQEFARALNENMVRHDGYMESDNCVVTWCVGHLVTMSYPDKYDEKYKKWSFETLPFLPDEFRYEVIGPVKKQFTIVKGLLNRKDVSTIYVCTDSGREGEYIYRLVAMMAKVPADKEQRRVWIDSQTDEEIRRGIREAKELKEYDNLSAAAFLRAKEDYLMGINFSRALSLRYSGEITNYLGGKYTAVAVGRVMTCVLGMVVRREREIRDFVKTPFYRVVASNEWMGHGFDSEWKTAPGSRYEDSPKLYKENGFRKREDAEELIRTVSAVEPQEMTVLKAEKKTTKKNPPLLYNLAEIQNECSRYFKISPDQTLGIIQELYEKKMVTYPRTDARVLSTAIAKVIDRNIRGLSGYGPASAFAGEVLEKGAWKSIGKSRYTDDKQITDHYAIIPTGQGLGNLPKLSAQSAKVYDLIVRRFLSIFYPPAQYKKVALESQIGNEHFFANFSVLTDEGYLKVAYKPAKKAAGKTAGAGVDAGKNTEEAEGSAKSGANKSEADEAEVDSSFLEVLNQLKKGSRLPVKGYTVKEGETSPPKRYTSGSMILAMENAGQLIEDDELREQIKGSGIGTSATRAEILKKLFNIKYLQLNKKTQVITPTQLGEMIYDVVYASIRSLLNPDLTASWEKGLTYVSEGTIQPEEYMAKLSDFVARRTLFVKDLNNHTALRKNYDHIAQYYKKRK